MKYIVITILILFIIIDTVININPTIRNVIYGIMSITAIVYLIKDNNNNGLKDIFKKDENSKSIFNIKELFRKK